MIALLLHELRTRRWAIVGWGVGLALFSFIYLLFYPQIAEQFVDWELGEIPVYRAFGITELATFAGYFMGSVINMLPILLGIYAIITGTGTLAGEEESGTLEILLALPRARWQMVTAKALAMAVAAFLILAISAAGSWLAFLLIRDQVETKVAAIDLVWSTLYVWPIAVAIMMMSLFLGSYLPTRRLAAVVAGIVLVVSYFGNNLAPLLDTLQPIQPLFLFNYFDSTPELLSRGPEISDLLVLLAVALAFFALALIAFGRRDVTAPMWPWQRAR